MEDRQILEIFRSGDENQAFNLLMREYREPLYWLARRMVCSHEDADDIVQNTFIKAWNAFPEFREESRLYTWLYRICTNESISFLKKKRLRGLFSASDYADAMSANLTTDGYFNGDKAQAALQKAINHLPPKQKNVFILRYFNEMKYEDISDITGISTGSLKASYHHAFEKVREELSTLVDE